MQKIYSRINWKNFPSEETAVNESNLNKMDLAIDNLDDRVVAMDASKVDLTKANELVKEILWDESNGTLTVVKMNGSRAVIDTKLEKLAVNFTYDPQTQQLVITLDDGTVQNVDLSSLITEYEFLDSDTIAFEIVNGKVKAIVKNGSITESHLAPEYLAEIRTQVGKAEMSAKSADASEKNAASSSSLAKSYAVGGTGTRDGEDTDNAKYYAEQAKNASDVGALSEIVENHISDKIVHMTESEHGVVSKLGESSEGSLTYNGSEIKPSVATTESTGVVKPDGKSMSVDESGTLSINLDGTTITLDEAKNVIKLADTLKDKIGSALQPESIVNNQITTVEGFALDARQANPNIDGSLAKQISDLNGSLKNDMKALNPSNAIRQCVACKLGKGSTGWYRFAEIAYIESASKGSPCTYAEIMMQQMYNESQGCFHKVNLYMQYSDKAKMTTVGQNNIILQKVRLVRKDNIIYLDVYSQGRSNETRILLYIPIEIYITSAKCVDPYLVPENSDGEVVVCSVDLANNI